MSSKFHNLKTLFKVTAISSGIIGISNQFIIYQSSQTKSLSRIANKKYFKSRFCDLFYTVKGSGSPVLLIHDLNPCGSGYEWYKIIDELSKYHTVYTIDLPGCGRSEKKNMIYSDFYFTSVLGEFLKKVIIDKTDIIASGYSCFLPFSLARNYNELIGNIYLVNPYDFKKYSRNSNSKDDIYYNILQLPLFGTLIYHIAFSRENIENMFMENYYFNPFHLDINIENAYYEAAHLGNSMSKYIYSSLIKNYTGCNMDKYVRCSNKNIIMIMGESESNSSKIIQQYKNVNSNIKSFTILKSKHFPHLENTEDFFNAISKLLS